MDIYNNVVKYEDICNAHSNSPAIPPFLKVCTNC